VNQGNQRKKFAKIDSALMAYVDQGQGNPIIFLHGNPTSSYLWRNIIPHVLDQGRAIAPDLIGMGESAKIEASGPERYSFKEHRRYLDQLIDQLVSPDEQLTLVIHDWGSALGFDWANRHRDRVKGICYMEGIVAPLTWADWPEASRPVFEALRSPQGEAMILQRNLFIERILPGSILRDMTPDEMEEYRRPFSLPGEGRRPTLSWPRQIPIEGAPEDVHDIVTSYAAWMAENDLPKLFINAEPGAILTGPQRDFCRSWKNQTEVTVKGSHFIQEDSPEDIGQALSSWLKTL
jgi:haloalkane dehalogenase